MVRGKSQRIERILKTEKSTPRLGIVCVCYFLSYFHIFLSRHTKKHWVVLQNPILEWWNLPKHQFGQMAFLYNFKFYHFYYMYNWIIKKNLYAKVLEFLTSEDTLTLPDKIEEVNSHLLMKIIEEEKFVTALFFDESQTSNDVLTGFRTFQPLNFQPQASSLDFSIQDFSNTNELFKSSL